MTHFSRTHEPDLYDAIETILIDAGGSASTTYIRKRITKYINLSPADRRQSVTRPGEEIWEQQVRNVVCHRNCDSNPIKVGRFVYSGRRLSLASDPQLSLFGNDNTKS